MMLLKVYKNNHNMKIKKQLIKVTFPSSNSLIKVTCSRDNINKIFDKKTSLAIKTHLKSIGEGWKGVSVSGTVNDLYLEVKIL